MSEYEITSRLTSWKGTQSTSYLAVGSQCVASKKLLFYQANTRINKIIANEAQENREVIEERTTLPTEKVINVH